MPWSRWLFSAMLGMHNWHQLTSTDTCFLRSNIGLLPSRVMHSWSHKRLESQVGGTLPSWAGFHFSQPFYSLAWTITVRVSTLPATFVTTSSNIISSNAKEFLFPSLEPPKWVFCVRWVKSLRYLSDQLVWQASDTVCDDTRWWTWWTIIFPYFFHIFPCCHITSHIGNTISILAESYRLKSSHSSSIEAGCRCCWPQRGGAAMPGLVQATQHRGQRVGRWWNLQGSVLLTCFHWRFGGFG